MTGLKALVGVAALMCSTSALAQAGGWTISEASGRVVVRDAGGDRPAGRGTAVAAGATLMTGPGARAVVVRGDDFVTVSANSRIRVPDAAQATGLFQMVSEWGTSVFKIRKQAKPHFAVQTPYLAAVVKGTTFSVTVGRAGASVQVTEGAVEVATGDGGARDLVRPGAVASVSAGDRYRLTVNGSQGAGKREIDSPARTDAPTDSAPGSEPNPVSMTAEGSSAVDGDTGIAWTDGADAIVSAPIEARPVDLAGLTGGLVSGRTATLFAATAVVPLTPAVAIAPNAPVDAAPVPPTVPDAPPAPPVAATSPTTPQAPPPPPVADTPPAAPVAPAADAAPAPAPAASPASAPTDGKADKPGAAESAPKPEAKPDDGKKDAPAKDEVVPKPEDKPADGKPDAPAKDESAAKPETKPDGSKTDAPAKDEPAPKPESKPDAGKTDAPAKDEPASKPESKPDGGKTDDSGKGSPGKDDSGKDGPGKDDGKADNSGPSKPDGKSDDAGEDGKGGGGKPKGVVKGVVDGLLKGKN